MTGYVDDGHRSAAQRVDAQDVVHHVHVQRHTLGQRALGVHEQRRQVHHVRPDQRVPVYPVHDQLTVASIDPGQKHALVKREESHVLSPQGVRPGAR